MPTEIFKEELQDILILDITQWYNQPKKFTTTGYASATISAEMKLTSPMKTIEYSEFDYPILYYLPKQLNYTSLWSLSAEEPIYYCLNWNEFLQDWVDDVCQYD